MESSWLLITLLLSVLWLLSLIERRIEEKEYITSLSLITTEWGHSVTLLERKFAILDSIYTQSTGIRINYGRQQRTYRKGD